MKKRLLRTFGVFAPRVCSGSKLPESLAGIYATLKSIGFRETRWQFIFESQIAGLVFPYNDGRNEVHIRFYDDRVFAEFEIGRASIAHFLGPFLNANPYILDLLADRVPVQDLKQLTALMDPRNLCLQEGELDVWDHRNSKKPAGGREGAGSRRFLLNFESANKVFDYFLWRNFNLAFGLVSATSAFLAGGRSLGFFVLAFFVLVTYLLPRVGRP